MSEALAEAFADLQKRFKPGVVKSPMTFYFSLGEEDGQKWSATFDAETMNYLPGKVDESDVFLKMEEALFLQLLAGEYKPTLMDFMSGKIKSNDPLKLTFLKDCFTRATSS
jgi:putative sterol carrier protein